jgi:two-component system response regulator QseB
MRLLLVEDDLMIGEDLQKALRKGGIVVNWVQDAETAQLTLKLETYDLIILDLGLPGKSGLELLGQIRTNGDDIPVLILTARDALSDKVKGFDTGADDYLLKPFALEELEARIRSLMRRRMGQAGNENGLLRHEQISLNPKTHEVFFNGSKIILSAKEFSLLHTLLKTPNAILSKSQLEENLYGWNEEIASNAIEVHISQIRKKMRADVIKTIRHVGYTLGNES